MAKRRLYFIVNPASGVRKPRNFKHMVERYLDHSRFDHYICFTEKKGSAIGLANNAVSEGADVVVAVGGDGTVNEVARGIAGSNAIMGLIPNGSGNGLARHLGIPLQLSKAIQVLNNQNIRTIDTATINDHLFASIAGIGFDAKVASRYERLGRRGFMAYLHIVVTEYFRYRSRPYKLRIDGKQMEARAMLISLANSNQFGYNTIIAPGADLSDGLLDIVIVEKIPFFQIPAIMGLVYSKQIDKSRFVQIHKGREIFIEREKDKRVNIDGESVWMGKDLHIRVNPGSLRVIST
jgi:diacylglycerol kinase (ATP)